MTFFRKSLLVVALVGICVFFTLNAVSSPEINPDNSWTEGNQELIPTQNINSNTVIMVHGFAGSPFDFKPLAVILVNLGYRVVLPATPGQLNQTYSYDFHDVQPRYYINWINNLVNDEIKKTKGKVYLAGFSMGGTISTIAAVSNTIDKLVLIAPFYSLTIANDFVWKTARFASRFIKGVPNLALGAINSPKGKNEYCSGSKVIRLESYDSLARLALIAAKCVPEIEVTTLIVGSVNDRVASFRRTKSLFKNKKNVKIIEYDKSDHVLLYDYDRDAIISNVVSFLENK